MAYVLIIEKETAEVVEKMGPMSDSAADRVEAGASINLNHAEFFVTIVSDEEAEEGRYA